MKTLQYRKISFFIGFCTIFLTPLLFAIDDEDNDAKEPTLSPRHRRLNPTPPTQEPPALPSPPFRSSPNKARSLHISVDEASQSPSDSKTQTPTVLSPSLKRTYQHLTAPSLSQSTPHLTRSLPASIDETQAQFHLSPRPPLSPHSMRSLPMSIDETKAQPLSDKSDQKTISIKDIADIIRVADMVNNAMQSPRPSSCDSIGQSVTRTRSNAVSDDEDTPSERINYDSLKSLKSIISQFNSLLLPEPKELEEPEDKKRQLLLGNNRAPLSDKERKRQDAITQLIKTNSDLLVLHKVRVLISLDKNKRETLSSSNIELYVKKRKIIFDDKLYPESGHARESIDKFYTTQLYQLILKSFETATLLKKKTKELKDLTKKKNDILDPSLPLEEKIEISKAKAKEVIEIKNQLKNRTSLLKEILKSDSSFTDEYKKSLQSRKEKLKPTLGIARSDSALTNITAKIRTLRRTATQKKLKKEEMNSENNYTDMLKQDDNEINKPTIKPNEQQIYSNEEQEKTLKQLEDQERNLKQQAELHNKRMRQLEEIERLQEWIEKI